MKIIMTPPLRNAFEMASRAEKYRVRLIDLCETEEKAKALHDSFYRAHQPVIHSWTTYNKIAMIDAVYDMTPTERKALTAIVEFEVK